MADDAAEIRAPIERWAKAVRHGDPVIDSQLVTGRTGHVVAVEPGPHRQQPPRQIRAAMPRVHQPRIKPDRPDWQARPRLPLARR